MLTAVDQLTKGTIAVMHQVALLQSEVSSLRKGGGRTMSWINQQQAAGRKATCGVQGKPRDNHSSQKGRPVRKRQKCYSAKSSEHAQHARCWGVLEGIARRACTDKCSWVLGHRAPRATKKLASI
ncbi:hypothetical protein N658DRAFT_495093 [Parathielavia hyrcaniae]|uniref:Uncharacterized protein n=1 Tax=Parathielavia hyrcaniae TaxID=113614 RepID=A0AAN6Q7X6_9PEZI|nr:hypothetical protein N658DRAFT_495093 [Parathielavia hyrcaniae]